MRMRHIVICVTRLTLPLFFTSFHKGRIFRKKKVTEHKICVFILSTTFISNISHSTNKWARYDQKCILVSMQSTRYSCPTLMKLIFSTDFRKILKYKISWKSVQLESSCYTRRGRHDEANSRFSQFSERPINSQISNRSGDAVFETAVRHELENSNMRYLEK